MLSCLQLYLCMPKTCHGLRHASEYTSIKPAPMMMDLTWLAVSNAGVESEGSTGTPAVDPFYNQPAAIGGYGASSAGAYGGSYSSPSPVGPPAAAPGPSINPAMAPAPLTLSAPAASGAAVESAPGSETLICYFSGVGCFSAIMADSETQSSTVQLECTSGSSSRVAYTIGISYPVGNGNWLSISPSSGSLLTNAATPTQ